MKKVDEMDKNIQLRSTAISYKVTLVVLSIWALYNSWQTLVNDVAYHPLPVLILCLAVSVQSFSEMAIKRKMIAEEEEYHEPNKLLWTILVCIVLAATILSVGTYFLLKV